MKQFTSPSLQSAPGRATNRPSGAAPDARVSSPVFDFAAGPRPPVAIPVQGDLSPDVSGATYRRIIDLPSSSDATSGAVFVPPGDPIPAPDPVTGLRESEERTYLNLKTGPNLNEITTIVVERDPSTGEWRERPLSSLQVRGPALHRVQASNTWRAGTSIDSSSSSPSISASSSSSSLSHSTSSASLAAAANTISLSNVARIDPVWNIDLYTLPVNVPLTNVPVFQRKKPFMIGAELYFMDVNYGNLSGNVPLAVSDLFAVGKTGVLKKVGWIGEEGIYTINNVQYLSMNSGFCKVLFDSARLHFKMVGPGTQSVPDIFIEMGGAPDSWVPVLAIDKIPNLLQSSRAICGYPGRTVAFDWVNSSIDQRAYSYVRSYLRQIIGFCEPNIRRAPVAEKGALIDAYIWRQGYPYDCLASIHSALPPGMPKFDALQGLATIKCSKNGNFNMQRIVGQMQLYYPERERSQSENVLLEEWKAVRNARDDKGKGKLNEKMYAARLTEDGYTLLRGGTYGEGQNGFDCVFEGPTGSIYLLEAKHVSSNPAGKLGSVSLGSTVRSRQMTNTWVHNVLKSSDPNLPAAQRVFEAMSNGQLFKLLGVTTPEGKLCIFKIDMSPVDF
ncbi:hypothetical protein [Pseudomonas sp. 2822-17]|uniref:hypothetical protein n=1 Tax=Pseudomonas sp. 2822-17 TaxID=1712678 RepID=UPI00117BB090|nr:hypothetical protein [Pseudomonas sp. 2822-17]